MSFQRTLQSSKTVVTYSRLHIDIFGSRTESFDGYKCFTVVVDEAAFIVREFTYRSKDQSADHVMAQIRMFVADGHCVKSVRTDGDSTYMSDRFHLAMLSSSSLLASLFRTMVLQSEPLVL